MTGSLLMPRRSRAKIAPDSVILSHNSIRAKNMWRFVGIVIFLLADWL